MVNERVVGYVNSLTQRVVDFKKPHKIYGGSKLPTIFVQNGKYYNLGKFILLGDFTDEIKAKYTSRVSETKVEPSPLAAITGGSAKVEPAATEPANIPVEPVKPKEEGFACDICGKVLKDMTGLKRHKTTKH